MSGFAGVFHLDGAPVDPAWLHTMAQCLAFRGPDGSQVWMSGNAGLCYTHLRTSAETDGRAHIATLDNASWIAGDVRIDDRDLLIAKLSLGSHDQQTVCSKDLILHAYARWGEACVDHLLGDFSFVIWDARRRRVFAARDHLGVKPFFYAQAGDCLVVSNTLDCIRHIPIVSDALNEHAIGDFLLVGQNKNPDTTYFTAIRRLPVAHRLTAGIDGVRTERYWTLPIEDPVYYKHAGSYVDRFRELLHSAVRDRLPTGPLGIFMSGGLDSPLLAATSVQLGAATTAFTSVFERLIPDEERHYAGLAARQIGIPIHYTVKDDESWRWKPASFSIHTAAPTLNPLTLPAHFQYHRDLSAHARVFFVGDGPDAALTYEWGPHLSWLLRKRRWKQAGRDLCADFAACPRIPVLHRLPRLWKEWRDSRDPQSGQPRFPPWFNKAFEGRLGLRQRWDEIHRDPISPHPTRPLSYAAFATDFPMGGAEGFDAEGTKSPAVCLHPFWDVRLLRFLLTVPAVPWCRGKYLIRAALRGLVPEAVRLRPKTPLPGYPDLEQMRRFGLPEWPAVSEIEGYVDVDALPARRGQWGEGHEELDFTLRALGLHHWLAGLQRQSHV
jgi:asparagine synthase (glutamine-hydrolysing)